MATWRPRLQAQFRRDFLSLAGAASVASLLPSSTSAIGRSYHGSTSSLPVELDRIKLARRIVTRVALHTPTIEESALSKLSGARVHLKLEDLQRTGAFKVRGAYNKIANLSQAERSRGVIAASTGNHAQGVALAANLFKIPATVFMPETVADAKLQATRAYGARVVLYGKTFDEALAKALETQHETGATFVHPYDDPMVIAGQGTIGLEILQDLPDPDIVLVPVGGGGLVSGIAVAIKRTRPSVRVIGVEAENSPSMATSLKAGKPTLVPVLPTLADGAAVAKPGNIPFAIARELVDDVITVSEQAISQSVLLLLSKDKVLAEGAGALGAAALLSGRVDAKGKKVVIVVSGGNIDQSRLGQLITSCRCP